MTLVFMFTLDVFIRLIFRCVLKLAFVTGVLDEIFSMLLFFLCLKWSSMIIFISALKTRDFVWYMLLILVNINLSHSNVFKFVFVKRKSVATILMHPKLVFLHLSLEKGFVFTWVTWISFTILKTQHDLKFSNSFSLPQSQP